VFKCGWCNVPLIWLLNVLVSSLEKMEFAVWCSNAMQKYCKYQQTCIVTATRIALQQVTDNTLLASVWYLSNIEFSWKCHVCKRTCGNCASLCNECSGLENTTADMSLMSLQCTINHQLCQWLKNPNWLVSLSFGFFEAVKPRISTKVQLDEFWSFNDFQTIWMHTARYCPL